MKQALLLIASVCALALGASAQQMTWATSLGGMTMYNGAVNGYSQRLGNSTVYNLNGTTTWATPIGGSMSYSSSDGGLNGWANRLGNSTVITDSYRQQTTWATPIGGSTWYSGAVNGWSTRLGNSTYYNLR